MTRTEEDFRKCKDWVAVPRNNDEKDLFFRQSFKLYKDEHGYAILIAIGSNGTHTQYVTDHFFRQAILDKYKSFDAFKTCLVLLGAEIREVFGDGDENVYFDIEGTV